MSQDFYCDEVLSGHTPVAKIFENDRVLAYYHTRPFYEWHIVVIPKQHTDSLLTVDEETLLELLLVIRRIAAQVVAERGACRVMTNLGDYQENKHLHWHIVSGERIRSG